MPPEALGKNSQYNAAIDMFSFGHLALYTLVQDFPIPTAPTIRDPDNPGMIVACSEVQRRSEQMEQVVRRLGGQRRPLVQLVTQCLHNDPRQRPSARQVLERMRAQIQDPYEGMSKLELIQALRRKEGGGGGAALQAQVTRLQVLITMGCGIIIFIMLIHMANLMQGKLSWRPVELRFIVSFTLQLQHQLEASRAETQQVQVCDYHMTLPCIVSFTLQLRHQLEASQAETQQVQVSTCHMTQVLP